MEANVEIDVVVVNWNAGRMIADCIASLDAVALDLPPIKVIVVDNASTDGSADHLQARNFSVMVLRNTVNTGFAGGCNQGVAAGSAPVLLFLNPDVIVTSADALLRPLEFHRDLRNASCGACGIQLRDESGDVARTLSPFPTPMRSLGWMTGLDRLLPRIFDPHFLPVADHLYSRPADSIMGAFLMIKRDLFERLGGFSTRFFVYYEDVDLCRRATYLGFRSWYMADVAVTHEGCGTTRNIRATRYFYSTRSRIIYGLRHFSPIARIMTTAGWMLIDPLVRVFYSAGRLSLSGIAETIRGSWLLWADAEKFLRTPRVHRDSVSS